MNNETQHGYLVLADISGYTSYLVGTELTQDRVDSRKLESRTLELKGFSKPMTVRVMWG